MAGRFPGAGTIDEFWENLLAGRDCLTALDDDELLRNYEDPRLIAHPDYVRKRPVFADSDAFDAQLFGMTPREAELHDPQYRAMLETVHAALEHAGHDPSTHPGQIGVFASTNVNRYRYEYIERTDVVETVGYLAVDIGNNPDYMSTYISYKLGLRGPSMTLLTACSSALVGVHLACGAIRSGECDLAIAGGVDIEYPYHRGYVPRPGGISAFDGTVRPFDADATGTNFGNGVGAVVLKPLTAALRDRDTIYATILATAINNDGNRKVGFSAPSVAGQSECIRAAMTAAGVAPTDISYVEAHGTGTRVGDPIELTGLADAYRSVSAEPLPAQYCAVGSVKANIGHLGQAAGIAGLIKTALALTHRELPPSIHFNSPNPEVDWERSPFYVNTVRSRWESADGRPRLAGVSSFGIGGTNAHAVLQEAPPVTADPPTRRTHEIVTWSAVDEPAEQALRERLADHFSGLAEDRFADAAFTLRVGRAARPVRAAAVAASAADAAAALRDPTQLVTGDRVARATVFAFPGQGAQHAGMCHRLHQEEPLFRQGCDAAFEVLRPLLDLDLRATWLAADADDPRLSETGVAQPLLYVLEYTLAHCLMQWGVRPDSLVGHSLGELVAAAVAGVFDFEDGLRAVAARGRAMQAMPRGEMLVVAAGESDVADLLTDGVVLAAVNAPKQVVLSGPTDPMRKVAAALAARDLPTRPLATSHAYHSPAMADAVAEFREALDAVTLHPPATPVISAVTGEPLTAEQAGSAAFWAEQLVEPVRFDRAAAAVLAAGPATVLEVGPGRTLRTLLRSRPDLRGSGTRLLPTVARDGHEPALERTLAQLWVDGAPVTYWRQDARRGYRRVAVPGYPYQRQRFWIDPVPRESTAPPPAPAPPAPVAPGPPAPPTPRWRLGELEWARERPTAPPEATGAGVAVLLAPANEPVARTVQAAIQRAGYHTIRLPTEDDPAGGGAPGADRWSDILDRTAAPAPRAIVLAHAGLLDAPAQVTLDTLDDQLTAGVASVHAALRAAAQCQRRHRVPTRVLVLGHGLVDVTGAEPVNPASAAVLGLLRTAPRELPGLTCQAVDVATGAAAPALSRAVAGDSPLLAVRGATLWRPRLREWTPPAAADRLRAHGTYLITGGLGGIGLVVAEALARTGLRPRIAVLGRTALADLPAAARRQAEATLAAVAELGAEVTTLAADVADPAALAVAVDTVQRQFGPVNGVVHAAGVAGGGLLERRPEAEIRRVLHPKVRGVLAIETVFAARAPLDFLLLFSSQAGLAGLYGSADYAAANAFLDAHSLGCHAASDRRTVSVQWPAWAEVGMFARSPEAAGLLAAGASAPVAERAAGAGTGEQATGTGDRTALEVIRSPGEDWEFDEHVFAGVPVLPGTSLLELAVLAARAAGVPEPGGGPLELRDTVFLRPVVGDGRRRVRVLLTAMASVHRFRIQSRRAEHDEPWTDHATGTVGPPSEVGEAALGETRERLTQETAMTGAGWIRYGPRWNAVAELRGDDTERVARLTLAEQFHPELSDHPLHPALLDLAAGVLTDIEAGRQYAPFLYRRVTVLGPLTADLTVHARFAGRGAGPRPVDFDIYDTRTGRALVRVGAFAMREAPSEGLAPPEAADAPRGAATATPGTTTATPGTTDAAGAGRPPARPGATEPSPDLLNPADGAAIMLDLLRHEPPPVVLVDQAASPLPVPGIPWPGADPTAGPDPAGVTRSVEAPGPPAPAPPTAPPTAPQSSPEPAGPHHDDTVEQLRKLWQDTLGTAQIADDDEFFDVGGNSLAAVQLTARIGAHFGVELGAGALFDSPTLRTLAAEIRQLRSATREDVAT